MRLIDVPARTGNLWVRQGIRTFWRQPLALTGLFFLFVAAVSLVGLLPWVGGALSLVLLPGATLGLMAATREADQGRFPMPRVLLIGFLSGPTKARAMLVLGLLYMLMFLCILGVSALIDGGNIARFYLLADAIDMDAPSVQIALLVLLLLYSVLSMVFWFAPALVHWHDVPPVKSLFFSSVACLRNLWAMSVYGMTWVSVFLSVMLLVSLLYVVGGESPLLSALVFPVGLLMAAMLSCSIFFTYHDSFEEASESLP